MPLAPALIGLLCAPAGLMSDAATKVCAQTKVQCLPLTSLQPPRLSCMHAMHPTYMLVNLLFRRRLPKHTHSKRQGISDPNHPPFTPTQALSSPLVPIRFPFIPCQANDDDGTKYLCSKAQLIDELEASLPGWVRRPAWYPQFVHLLKVRPGLTVAACCSHFSVLCHARRGCRPGTPSPCTC